MSCHLGALLTYIYCRHSWPRQRETPKSTRIACWMVFCKFN